jgi:lysophospholipid acyltransferase (LPLAT)-like uncharacterized protein
VSLVESLSRGFSPRLVAAQDVEHGFSEVTTRFRGHRFVLYYWVSDVLPLLWALCVGGVNFAQDVVPVSSGNWLGTIVTRILRRHGQRVITISTSGASVLVSDVQLVLREQATVCITADGRGPFGVVSPGLVRLVGAKRAVAIPLATAASCAWSSRRPIPCTVPLPWSRIAVALGEPVVPDEVDADSLRGGLVVAKAKAKAVLLEP